MDQQSRPSIIIHLDSLDVLDKLTPEQSGELFKAIRDYNIGVVPEMSMVVDLVFTQFKNQFDRDIEKYHNVCKRNKENGKKGGRPITQKTQVVNSITQNNPNNHKSKSKNNSKSNNKNKNKNINIDSFDENIKPSVELIVAHREEMNKPITKRGIDMLLKKLDYYAKHNDITFDDALDFWLGENWQGIDVEYKYPFRQTQKKNTELSYSEITQRLKQERDSVNNGNQPNVGGLVNKMRVL